MAKRPPFKKRVQSGGLSTGEKLASKNPAARREGQAELKAQPKSQQTGTRQQARDVSRRFPGTTRKSTDPETATRGIATGQARNFEAEFQASRGQESGSSKASESKAGSLRSEIAEREAAFQEKSLGRTKPEEAGEEKEQGFLSKGFEKLKELSGFAAATVSTPGVGDILGGVGVVGGASRLAGRELLKKIGTSALKQNKAQIIATARKALKDQKVMRKFIQELGRNKAAGEQFIASKGLSHELAVKAANGQILPNAFTRSKDFARVSFNTKIANKMSNLLSQTGRVLKNPFVIAGILTTTAGSSVGTRGAAAWGDGDMFETIGLARNAALRSEDKVLLEQIETLRDDMQNPSFWTSFKAWAPAIGVIESVERKRIATLVLMDAQDAKVERDIINELEEELKFEDIRLKQEERDLAFKTETGRREERQDRISGEFKAETTRRESRQDRRDAEFAARQK